MENSQQPAFPMLTYNTSTGNADGHFLGMIKAEWFAAHAPQIIPSWFTVDDEAPISQPSFPELAGMSDQDVRIFESWRLDPNFDLPAHLQRAGEKWDKYCEEVGERDKKRIIDRFFQWRAYYGHMMAQIFEPCTP